METDPCVRLLLGNYFVPDSPEAEKRMENTKAENFIPAEKAMQELGISETDLDGTDVELE